MCQQTFLFFSKSRERPFLVWQRYDFHRRRASPTVPFALINAASCHKGAHEEAQKNQGHNHSFHPGLLFYIVSLPLRSPFINATRFSAASCLSFTKDSSVA